MRAVRAMCVQENTADVVAGRRHQDSTLDWNRWDEAWVCTAWIPLDDVDAESGAMWMVPGAHLWGDACADPPFLTSPPVSASTSLDDVQPVVSGAAAAAHCKPLNGVSRRLGGGGGSSRRGRDDVRHR